VTTEEQLGPHTRAGDVLQAHLTEQVQAMTGREEQARTDEPDGVHKMRVASRRLRSALATFRPLLHREQTDPLRSELKWIATELGGARDAEVLRMRLLDHLAAEPDELVLGPVPAQVAADLGAAHRRAHQHLVTALDSERYRLLRDRLGGLVADPPFTDLADGPADPVLTDRLLASYRKIRKLVRSPVPADPVHRGEWYHEIRKAAKRLRYAAEAVMPAFGPPAAELAGRAEVLQEVLGEHQDSVVARAALRDLGVRLHLEGHNAFTIGRLHALEERRAGAAIDQFDAAWAALSAKSSRSWLQH
jgi:CHAD domain-containing protein